LLYRGDDFIIFNMRKEVPFFRPFIGNEDVEEVLRVLKSGWLTTGAITEKFEKEFCRSIGAGNCVFVNSGTAALHLLLDAYGVGPGDEVIVPAVTFIATAEAVEYTGAKVILADVDRESMNISVDDLARKITERTKAIIPVHIAGVPCEMDEIMRIAKERNILVIEDAAHAFLSFYRGKHVGISSDGAAFSFYATKPITTGEGGMVVTRRREVAELIRLKRLHGIKYEADVNGDIKRWKYDVVTHGYKYNATDFKAALGISQLKKATLMKKMRKREVEKYVELLRDCELIQLPVVPPHTDPSWHLFVVKLKVEKLTISRDRVIEELKKRGVGASMHFIPLYRFSIYRDRFREEDFPGAEFLFERVISLPLFPSMEDQEVEYVVKNLIDILEAYRK